MAVAEFQVKEQWVGTNDLTDYTFDFTIQDLSHLLVILQDSLGNVQARVRGDDSGWLAGVVFDPVEGGGTISLKNPLTSQWVLTALMANDAPTQPSEFKEKFSFTLPRIEAALDFIVCQIQRLAYLAQRSVKLNDIEDVDAFDLTLPLGMTENPRATIIVNAAANGFDLGPTSDEILAGQGFAMEAAASASEAVASAVNADQAETAASISAAAAAVSATEAAMSAGFVSYTGPFASIAPGANLNLPGEVTNSNANKMVEFTARIVRGTTVFASQKFTITFRNLAWRIAIAGDLYDDAASDHGVTFTADAVTAQINAAVANDGGNNAVIDIIKTVWPN